MSRRRIGYGADSGLYFPSSRMVLGSISVALRGGQVRKHTIAFHGSGRGGLSCVYLRIVYVQGLHRTFSFSACSLPTMLMTNVPINSVVSMTDNSTVSLLGFIIFLLFFSGSCPIASLPLIGPIFCFLSAKVFSYEC